MRTREVCSNRPFQAIIGVRGGNDRNLIYVTVQPNESIDSALKRFNMKLQQSGLLRELKEHAHYEKPSEKRRRMARRSKSRN
jgi:small subunit ribosomal protein S21